MNAKGFGLVAGAVTAIAAAGVGVAAAEPPANAQASAQVYAREASGPCFSTVPAASACAPGETAEVSINTGESVTWNFGTDGSTVYHNAAGYSSVPTDAAWDAWSGEFRNSGTDSYTFTKPGDYEFVCEAHQEQMRGVVHVTGAPVETPTVTPTPTPTPTVTPHPQPGGGGTTPPPGGGLDQTKPTVRSIKLKPLRRAARVTFTVSENATVTIRVRRGKKVVKTVRLQARAGTHTVKVRSRKLKRGHYRVEIRARDAFGNTSSLAKKSLRFRR